jgi:DNA-binding NarL/FixJ family response regulator
VIFFNKIRNLIFAFINQLKSEQQMKDKTILLTLRECEVLEHLSNGKLNKEIANELEITEGTVKQHLSSIYSKLDLKNRVEASNLFKSSQLE